jgi:threonylcarbamoyladenosine tRNA methylthiotransferase MtaB
VVDIPDNVGGLGKLCRRLLDAQPRQKRLRLSSHDSIEIDEELFDLIAGEPRLMPHFHLSLQAGDDLVLKRMKRRHSRADAVRTVERIKAARPDATIGADLIAGFPTETEDMALNSLRLLDDCDVVAAHVFPFSPRPGTPAARMPQVEREIVKARAARLREAAAARRVAWLDRLIGSTQRVLVEHLHEKSGAEVTLEELDLSIFSGLELKKFRIGPLPGFQEETVSFDRFAYLYSFWSLFLLDVVIDDARRARAA